MCGIIGKISRQKPIDGEKFDAMRDTLRHRGPDGCGTEILNDGRVALGHRRLSIIDLTPHGRQPMANEDGMVWLTFNGEIYNYRQLRAELQESGDHLFHSETDSEVLIHGYEQWGMEGLLPRLKGMFAFAIWDQNRRKLFAARDRFGIKPFVYYLDNQIFSFASETKALMRDPDAERELDRDSLADYFRYAFVPQPGSIWKKVRKLPAAHFLEYDFSNHSLTEKRYWESPTGQREIPEKQAVEEFKHLLEQATQEHLVSDVPVGLFLSGGYDSSSLLMNMAEQQGPTSTFSLGYTFHPKSEHHQARAVAKTFGAHHHEKMLRRDTDGWDMVQRLAPYYDEPYAVSSMFTFHQVAELAAKTHKVVLSGDGGDEVLAGYIWYNHLRWLAQKSRRFRLRALWSGKGKLLAEEYMKFMPGRMGEIFQKNVLTPEMSGTLKRRGEWHYRQHLGNGPDVVKNLQLLDARTFMLDACLHRADISSMMHSLEVRVPFLDHHLFEYTMGLKTELYHRPNVKKPLLKAVLKEKLPAKVLDMPKRGFSFKGAFCLTSGQFRDLFEDGYLIREGILRSVRPLEVLSPEALMYFAVLELWFRQHYRAL